MRKIKFRAWDKPTEQMIYDVSVSIDTIGFGPDDDIDAALKKKGFSSDDYNLPEHWCDTGDDFFFVLNDFELMQFTGLKDKNGNEIYEGDVVQDESKMPQIIRFGECYNKEAGIEFHGWYVEDIKTKEPFAFSAGDGEVSEIIGNIYENPEKLQP
jgi:uncharacterized phage protein (TIGR01671 family)